MNKEKLHKRIQEIERAMLQPDFWNDKDKAQALIQELQNLKVEAEGAGKYDSGNAIVSILSGAGGDDAEDFSAMLYRMYQKYIDKENWSSTLIHQNENNHGGFRNITFEVAGKGVYGRLKNESGVHRLVRLSPFNAKKLRHTSFSLVEVIPKLKDLGDIDIPEDEIELSFTRSGGPGGQNVNKRETAVRVVHTPSGLSAYADGERSQAQNKERALAILKGKVYRKREEDQKKEAKGLSVSATTEIEWGSQIRSYVLHPYKMIKDHRTEIESRDVDGVLLNGELDIFIDAELHLE